MSSGLVLPSTFLKGDVRVRSREPRPEWVAALRALSPVSDQHSWLHLAWEPGDDWDPIERWLIYQVVPWARVGPTVRAELLGPDPRSTGHYCGPRSLCGCPPNRRPDLWVGGAAGIIDHAAWRLYRELVALQASSWTAMPPGAAGWARPWWVIQGAHGGHPRYYTSAEAALAELADLPSEPPVPGEWPYAEPDQRTWEAVAAADRVRQGAKLLERTAADFQGEQRERALQVRRATYAMLRRASRDALDAYGDGMRRELSEFRLGAFAHRETDRAHDVDADLARELFIENV